MEIREATDDDAAAVTRLTADANPSYVMTPAAWIHRRRTAPERARVIQLVAEVGGAVVGRGQAGLNPNTTTRGAASAGVIVAPTHRRAGVGDALAERVGRHLAGIGATTCTTTIFETQAGIAFAERHGFHRERTAAATGVDPRTVRLALPGGVEVAPVADLGPEVVYEIDVAGSLDEPVPNPPAAMPYDEWLADLWNDPSFTAEGSVVALADGTPAAIALLYVAPEHNRAVNAFTATLPRFRGKGLALAAKIATMHWAAANGITRVTTANDDTNGAMLAINARLGYQPIGRLVTMRRAL